MSFFSLCHYCLLQLLIHHGLLRVLLFSDLMIGLDLVSEFFSSVWEFLPGLRISFFLWIIIVKTLFTFASGIIMIGEFNATGFFFNFSTNFGNNYDLWIDMLMNFRAASENCSILKISHKMSNFGRLKNRLKCVNLKKSNISQIYSFIKQYKLHFSNLSTPRIFWFASLIQFQNFLKLLPMVIIIIRLL